MNSYETLLQTAASVKPSSRQLTWFGLGFYGFIHFTVNTYTGREWGLGTEDPAIFNPVDLDCDEWVEAMQKAGMQGVILTAKHHDGFCLWQTKYTDHSVKSSPWKDGKGDVVRELSEACRRHNFKFGIYLSPWDRNAKTYGTPEYNDYYAGQLEELLTGYGELFCIWQDNACGEGPNGKRQVYDFPRFNALIRKHQPKAFIFNDFGPDVRWCGNEAGTARPAEWAVVPGELCHRSEEKTPVSPLCSGGLAGIYNTDDNLGSIANIQYAESLVFAGSEFDTSIRPGWFYHENEHPHPVSQLFETYLRTWGGNGCLNLNIPPMPNGRFHPDDIKTLEELGDTIRRELAPTPSKWELLHDEKGGRRTYKITLPQKTDIRYIILRENIATGQKIEAFRLKTADGSPWSFYQGYTVGNRKACRLKNPLQTDTFYFEITSARAEADMLSIEVCGTPCT